MVAQPFDAAGHMRKIRTKQGMQDYLDVKWRIAWIRAEHPDAQIITEQIDSGPDFARFKAIINLPSGAIGCGHGSETAGDFPDFYEKAETKAIGRACAVLGYGTDSASDLDDGEPMDGRAAAKDERSERRMEPGEREQVDAQHQRNTAPPPSSLPQTRSPAGQRHGGAQQPDGQERVRANVEEKCRERGVAIPDGASYATIAERVNAALLAAGKTTEVRTDQHGQPTPGDVLNALRALPVLVTA